MDTTLEIVGPVAEALVVEVEETGRQPQETEPAAALGIVADDQSGAEREHDHQPTHGTDLSYGLARSPQQVAAIQDLLLPSPTTPGFDLCSPRVFQVVFALLFHALRHGAWCCPDKLPDDERYAELRCIRQSGLTAFWTMDLIASACGIDRKTVERLMAEMRDLGWVRWSRQRDADERYLGIIYVLLVPPSTLSETAKHRYGEQLTKRQQKIAEAEARLERGKPDYRLDDDQQISDSNLIMLR
jgi:hypothetical protein